MCLLRFEYVGLAARKYALELSMQILSHRQYHGQNFAENISYADFLHFFFTVFIVFCFQCRKCYNRLLLACPRYCFANQRGNETVNSLPVISIRNPTAVAITLNGYQRISMMFTLVDDTVIQWTAVRSIRPTC